ncbi:LPXTG cell wall anchor domain-containing protein [Staphylococcus caprae]|mgnify:FL=1
MSISDSGSASLSTDTSTSISISESHHQGSLAHQNVNQPSRHDTGEQHLGHGTDSSEYLYPEHSNTESTVTSENDYNNLQAQNHQSSHQHNDESLPDTGENTTNRSGLVSTVLAMLAGLGLVRKSRKDRKKDRKNNED